MGCSSLCLLWTNRAEAAVVVNCVISSWRSDCTELGKEVKMLHFRHHAWISCCFVSFVLLVCHKNYGVRCVCARVCVCVALISSIKVWWAVFLIALVLVHIGRYWQTVEIIIIIIRYLYNYGDFASIINVHWKSLVCFKSNSLIL